MWNLVLVRLETVLVSVRLEIVLIFMQDMCTVGTESTITSKIILDTPDGTAR
jgi:hypothetical protein